MLLAERLPKAKADALAADPVLFVRAFDRDPWPYQVDILRQALDTDDTGRFTHRVAVVSMPRQNGKSTLSAWAALWRFYTQDNQTIVTVANDREQARVILNDARRIISESQILHSLLDDHGLTKTEIRLINGNRWIVKAADALYVRGLRPSLVLYDELGWTVDRDLFDTLSAGQAAQENPLILVTSTVGPVQAGILWELFERAREGAGPVKLLYYQENLSPLVTEDFLSKQRQLLPGVIFAREHLNTWGAGSEAFCTLEDWQRATSDPDPRRADDPGPCFAFLDLGWVHDETALAVVARLSDGRAAVRALETWRGSQAAPVDFSTVEARLQELATSHHIRRLVIESPQGVALAQRLALTGLSVEVLHPTAKSNRENWGALYTALKNGRVVLPNDARLRRQLLTLQIESKATGWRVVDDPTVHNDRAVAVAGAVSLSRHGAYTPMPTTQPAQAGRWNREPPAAGNKWRRF